MFANVDWNEVLLAIENLATSSVAKEKIRQIKPLKTVEESMAQIREIEDSRRILMQGLRPYFHSLDLFYIWYDRLTKNAVLKVLELRDLRSFLVESVSLEELLRTAQVTDFGEFLKSSLMDARRPLSAIEQVLTPDAEIRTDASETLHRLFKEKQDKEREVRVTLDRLVKSHQMESILQDKFVTNREGRWVLPIKSGMRHDIDGIIHDVSHTKQTVFMEPQVVVQINNHLRTLEVEIEEEIQRILKELSNYLSTLVSEFKRTRELLELCDVRMAQAQFATTLDAIPPEFTSDRLNLRGVRHPILSLKLGVGRVVSNTVVLTDKKVLILSGPNAGGKTVLLKSIGLAAHMARCGLCICAERGAEVPFFENVHASVGDSQSVDQQLSTFAAHIKSLSEALTFKGASQLVLIDEICGSTDPEEGAALARAFVEAYADNGVYAVITSHLGPLKSGWAPEQGILTGSMDFDDRSNQPTFQLVIGLSGRSLAIKTAKKVGVPEGLIKRAMELMGPEAQAREDRMARLEEDQRELNDLKDQYRKLSLEADTTKKKYQELVDKFKNQRDVWLQKVVDQAEKKIQAIYDEVREVFKKESSERKSVNDFKAQLPQIIKSTQKTVVESPEDFAKAYPAGSAVYIKSLNQDGVVQGTPNSKGELPVLTNSMRLFVHWTGLGAPQTAQNPTPMLARRSGLVSVALKTEDRDIDLRGYRVEDALEQLERELDDAVRNKEERVRVIHGHGTEVLKRAVRTYFSRSQYVKKWKAGDGITGGDGITWVELSD